MPFTLAHPAAVLPLTKRFLNKLDFTALVVGSIVPDLGYIFSRFKLDEVSHGFPGSFTFCLPAGLLVLGIFHWMRDPFLKLLPARERNILQAGFPKASANLPIIVASLLLGTWTHQLWDGFTHRHGWFVLRSSLLQQNLYTLHYGTYSSHELRVSMVIWYISSLTGIFCMANHYLHWLAREFPAMDATSSLRNRIQAAVLSILIFPVEVFHHLYTGKIGNLVVLFGSASLLAGSLFLLGRNLKIESEPKL